MINQLLLESISNQDLEKMKALLDEGVDIETRTAKRRAEDITYLRSYKMANVE